MTLLFRATTPFQSTLPRRERQTLDGFISLLDNFNSRSREGSDVCHHCLAAVLIAISIHAPAKGATVPSTKSFADGSKFQSTLPRRERRLQCGMLCSCYLFQSTLPRRERQAPTGYLLQDTPFQSTLPRRERRLQCSMLCSCYLFQSTLPRRERQWCKIFAKFLHKFQSTLPRRERLLTGCALLVSAGDFNPRSREGSDTRVLNNRRGKGISIHAPAKGATTRSEPLQTA